MPVVFGSFETSLRGGDSPSIDRKVLHKGCCGDRHGQGVRKERSVKDLPKASKSCSHELHESSSDESFLPDLLMTRSRLKTANRSQSSDCTPSRSPMLPANKRSNSAAVAHRLFSSPTKATSAKLRAERTASDGKAMSAAMKTINKAGSNFNSMNNLNRRVKLNRSLEEHDGDSGHFSSDNDQASGPRFGFVQPLSSSEQRKRSLITGASDDELSIADLRQKRRDFGLHLGSRAHQGSGVHRKESPSPGPKGRYGDRGRRSSDEYSESSTSPPATPSPDTPGGTRSISMKPWTESRELAATAARRTASSGSHSGVKKSGIGFGSSSSRFVGNASAHRNKSKPAPLNKSSSDGVQNADLNDLNRSRLNRDGAKKLGRTTSDPRSGTKKGGASAARGKDNVAKAWLQFKEDIESAMQRKPNQGYYKTLSDMMDTKMELLNDDQVGNGCLVRKRNLDIAIWTL